MCYKQELQDKRMTESAGDITFAQQNLGHKSISTAINNYAKELVKCVNYQKKS